MTTAIDKSIQRREAWDKVTGQAQYCDDLPAAGMLSARLLTSTYAHARLRSVDIAAAQALPGVECVLTGADCPQLFGPLLQDRPALARDKVRYAGEPLALVVAVDEPTAEQALRLIEVDYEPLPPLLKPAQALERGAPLLHGQGSYKKVLEDIYPEPGTNIASHYRIRKGDSQSVLQKCAVIVRQCFGLPPSGHLAMEIRTARAEITAQGQVLITTSSQSPYSVRKQLAEAFLIPAGQIQVKTPLVGGGFGGKAAVCLEILAYLASRGVGGKKVRLTLPREQDMATAPCRLGLEAEISIGADQNGLIQAAELNYYLDCGAYTDIAPYMAKAIAVDCSGPYQIANLSCDALCVYTNHTYATSFRGFSHAEQTFCLERTLDMLAQKCGDDPLQLRLKNAIGPGCTTPTQVAYSAGLIGDLPQCLEKIQPLSCWDGGGVTKIKPHTVRVKGLACFWKTANPPTDAISGAVITFNPDGSVNLNTGAVEMGSGCHTHLNQILAERLQLSPDQVHVVAAPDTQVAPEHWKTVASLTVNMAGRAVLAAADDALSQLRVNAGLALGCPDAEIEIAAGRAFSKKNPERFIPFKDIVQGYKSPAGQSLGQPVIGRGSLMLKGLSLLDPYSGSGRTGPDWSLGAQVVEVEADLRTYTYRIISASTAMDVGRAINPELMRAVIAGGMAMGVSLASRESFAYNSDGIPLKPNLRTYKLMHIGEEPDYRVDFVETPEQGSPYGVRSYSEHGIIGMPAALGNALSRAFACRLNTLPLNPERIWRAATEGDS
ncbi:MAG: xanthine dehydrogenase family protein molybdopterin-binding subunit [Clostridia bacterium]|nr:xanthine dehydrogenase family protein molybdopterin-binding subunit [Clostridia bacterium]